MDTSRLAIEGLQTLAGRFSGVDLQYRAEGWGMPGTATGQMRWKARLHTNKNERSEYRVIAYGLTALEAVAALSGMVTQVERDLRKPQPVVHTNGTGMSYTTRAQ